MRLNSRRGFCVEQDIPVLQILGVGPLLEVFLKGVVALVALGWG